MAQHWWGGFNLKENMMTAHELARQLLMGPDLTVVARDPHMHEGKIELIGPPVRGEMIHYDTEKEVDVVVLDTDTSDDILPD